MTERENSRVDVHRITDFEAPMLIIERDAAQFKANRIDELLNNLPKKWSHAYNILRQNNAVINSRYSGSSYNFSTGSMGKNRIYRQRLKAQG